ncbi:MULTISPECIES: ABC transporter permease [unclassified Mesorhizobium]|uniref:ABC transporter permease n=1 Tax=unclassified Mesorhizobium TaxID=325217 RepID=UPI00241512AF|nr:MULTISPECIES: ABC transporter permease [unclassified Mesorhizobium]MDG4889934.1 ABC transporter permease [Mesorhizobium sp. WSM4887]MDG4904077.1 ABC transporter permease [Mesorhizobium sp. WSM4962]MDG4909104.1 ABC transporter permease [Mesorhizobium sp. WSM4898]MDG4921728.1 ABC transporter permease [Mesorhizobium sp. WSM4989]
MTIPAETVAVPSPRRLMVVRALHHPGFLLSGAILLTLVILAISAPLIAPHDAYLQNLVMRLRPPVFLGGSWDHPLGTDALGRDYFSRLLYGAGVSLMIGFTAASVSTLIGTTLGILAGYFGGRVDAVVRFIINVRLALPVVLVSLAIVSLFGGSLFVITTVLGLLLWDRAAVVIRSATMQVRNHEYIAAAEVLGAPLPRILIKDILPNIANALIVICTIEMAHAIILESALSFLGLGVQPPTPSWGLMISEGKEMLLFNSWLIAIPGAALFVLVLAINMFGDGIRDLTTPEGRN